MAAVTAVVLSMEDKQVLNHNTATIVYQMTEEQLLSFAHQIVAETRDSVAEEIHRRVAHAVGNRFDYCSMKEAIKITGKTRCTLRDWMNKGKIHYTYNGNKLLLLREDVNKEAKENDG